MIKEHYGDNPVPGVVLYCGECAGLVDIGSNLECMECGHIIDFDPSIQDPPTVGINFGFVKPTKTQIAYAKQELGAGEEWCVVEGVDAQFRLYKLR